MTSAPRPASFPSNFVWGTATASYQIEGATNVDGRGTSIWDTFATTDRVLHHDNGDIATDHYHRYEEDLDLLQQLGVTSYRFSIAWPRIQADGTGAPNQKGLDFYRHLVAGLKARNIEPSITLYHWDLPQALEDQGGWTNRETAYRFAEYVGHVVDALGEDVTRWITINEPWCVSWLGYGAGVHAPGITDIGKAVAANHHILLAHGLATDEIRARLPHAQVGITLNLALAQPFSDNPLDVAAAARSNGNHCGMFLDPVFKGEYPALMREHYGSFSPGFSVVNDGDMEILSRPLDFIGVNYYSYGVVADPSRLEEARAAGYNVSPAFANVAFDNLRSYRLDVPGRKRTAMGWEVDATGLRDILLHVSGYTDLPIFITENGAAAHDYVDPLGKVHDEDRINYIRDHLGAVADARAAGADVQGYYVWSMLDNYEWAEGYSKRFGIVWVDYPTGERTPKDSYYWYQGVIKSGVAN